MRIGELAGRSGLSTSRIRFYEAKGLLDVVSRKANGYRDYPADALVVLGIIVGAQRTGFSLDEIRQILPKDLQSWRHGELMDALHRKIADIEEMESGYVKARDSFTPSSEKLPAGPMVWLVPTMPSACSRSSSQVNRTLCR
jgi:DNA-binding transcriptional MerR regulator